MSCPICARTTDDRYRPFCSRRCSDVDLARWLSGSYAVPAQEDEAPNALPDAMETRDFESFSQGNEKLH